MPRHPVRLAAALAALVAVSGCVAYPAGYGYGTPYAVTQAAPGYAVDPGYAQAYAPAPVAVPVPFFVGGGRFFGGGGWGRGGEHGWRR